MRNAVDSGQQSGMLYALVEPFLSGLGIGTDLGHTLLRKLAHMTEYAVLGIFWSLQQRKSTCKFSIQGLAVRWQICVLGPVGREHSIVCTRPKWRDSRCMD